MDYKILFISLLTICMIGCRKDQVYTMRCLRITDYKPYSDSLYKAKGGYSVREIQFYYSLPNHSNKPIYVPLRTWFRKNVSSEIKVFFVDNTDTVIPHYSIDKVPCNSNIINANDSMLVMINIFHFPDWQTKWINADSSLDTVIKKLRLEYVIHHDDLKPDLRPIKIKFETSPLFIDVIPPGMDQIHPYWEG